MENMVQDPFEMARRFNGCTSNCGSVCDYIVDLTDEDFESTIASLTLIGAKYAVASLEASRSDRIAAIKALAIETEDFDIHEDYFKTKKIIDSRKYENEEWDGWDV